MWKVEQRRCWILLVLVVVRGGVASAASRLATRRIELTDSDLLARRNWSSLDVSILGFHLGMARREAEANARRQGDRVVENDWPYRPCTQEARACAIFDGDQVWIGLDLYFDGRGHVSELRVERVPPFADVSARRANVARRFKGMTRNLFFNYSNGLRTRLLGTEDSRVLPTEPGDKAVRFEYRRLGLALAADPAFGARPADIVVLSLVQPGRPVAE
jgi:hypothetical protein